MAKNRVIPVRLDDELLASIDAALAGLRENTIGRNCSRSDFIRMCIKVYILNIEQAEKRKRKGKVPCSVCGQKLMPARMASRYTDLFGQDIYTCPTCEHAHPSA